MKQKAIIVDMDDTICENVTDRPWYGKGAAEGMLEDEPKTDLINMIRAYCDQYDVELLVLTGRHKELNKDPEQSGMFDDNGRVKAIKLRGEISEGFILPITVLENYVVSVTNKELGNVKEGIEFDAVQEGVKEFWISKKYVPQRTYPSSDKPGKITKKVPKGLDKVIETQFRFHYDTTLIKKCPYVITPESIIQLSYKIHGTSGISAYVLCRQPLNWKQKIAKWLTGTEFDIYDHIYSSRTVIKNRFEEILGKETSKLF